MTSLQQWSSKSSLIVLLRSRSRAGAWPGQRQFGSSLAGHGARVHFDLLSQAKSVPRCRNQRRAAPNLAASSFLRRRRGLGHQPVEIALIDALDRDHQEGRRGVGVHLFDRRAHALRERVAGLDEHYHLLAALDRALPPIVRDHPGQDVGAGAQVLLDQRASGPLRLDNGWIGRIDEDVALGGDGLMLQTLHRFMSTGKPIYGMHRGTVGFLMNEFHPDHLPERLAKAHVTVIHPLLMRAHDSDGNAVQFHAFNDVFLYRQTYQAARLRILIDGEERLSELVADGMLVATPAGSTAYNLSVQGPIIPISAPLMALTPISPFRPRRWRGALLPDSAKVRVV